MTIRAWANGSLRVEYSDSWVANGRPPLRLLINSSPYASFATELSLSDLGALINLLGDAAKYVASLRYNPEKEETKLERLVREANERFDKMTPEQQAEHRREQRKSWCRGEFFLAHPEKTEDDFNAIWGKVGL